MEAASRTATPVADDDRTGRYNFIVSMEVDRVNPIVPVTVAGCPANRKGTQPKRLPSTLWTSRLPFAKGKSIVCPRPVRKLVLEFSSPVSLLYKRRVARRGFRSKRGRVGRPALRDRPPPAAQCCSCERIQFRRLRCGCRQRQ